MKVNDDGGKTRLTSSWSFLLFFFCSFSLVFRNLDWEAEKRRRYAFLKNVYFYKVLPCSKTFNLCFTVNFSVKCCVVFFSSSSINRLIRVTSVFWVIYLSARAYSKLPTARCSLRSCLSPLKDDILVALVASLDSLVRPFAKSVVQKGTANIFPLLSLESGAFLPSLQHLLLLQPVDLPMIVITINHNCP